MTEQKQRRWLDRLAGQAHSALVANAAFGHSPRYHDDMDMDKCNGPSCQWYRDAKAELNVLESRAAAWEALCGFFASVIKSGEAWSSECEARYAALKEMK